MFCPFVLFLLTTALSSVLRFTDSDYPFGIFKLFLLLPATTELRQAWVNSIKNEKFGSRLPVRKLPFCLLRQQVCDRRLHCKNADLLYWKSDEDKKKIADKRKCFDRQWTTEISKRYLLSVYINIEINIVSGTYNLWT